MPRLHDTPACQTGCTCTTGLTTVLNEQPLFVQHSSGLTTVLNEQLFLQPIVKHWLYNQFDNQLYTIHVYTVVKPV